MKKKIALVTGGVGGIGSAICKRLAEDGHFVVANYGIPGTETKWLATMAAAGLHPGSTALAFGDVTQYDAMAEMVAKIAAEHGPVDILVNCAGITKRTPTLDVSDQEWDSIIATNLTATFRACQIFGRSMLGNGYGRIINIASLTSFVGLHEVAAYTASKSAVAGLTRALAVEWGPRGVNVNAIAPGVFRTALNTRLLDESGRGQELLERTPLKRFGRVEELAPACVFLASEGASFVNGEVLTVDGGFLASGVNQ